jgi:hypothetical protein
MSEPDEIFFVDLGTPVNASVGRARARVVIVDDDSPGRQLLALGGQVLALDLGPFQTAHLLSKLQLNCGTLNAFTRQVTQWNHAPIPPAEANALTAAANRLRADIGCKP